MISNEIKSLINKQINDEIWSAYLYLSMSLDSYYKDYSGAGQWFYVQAMQEIDHACRLQKYLLSQGQHVDLLPIDGVPTQWTSLLTMFEDAMNHEKAITKCINNIVNQAKEEQDYATLSMLMWFVDEQIEEEQTALTMVNKLRAAQGNSCYMYEIDKSMKTRKYRRVLHNRSEQWL